MKFINPLEQKAKKGLTSVMGLVPQDFRWIIYYSLTEGLKLPIGELVKNKRAHQAYVRLKEIFPTAINQKYEEVLKSDLTKTDILKLKNIISEKSGKEFWDLINEIDSRMQDDFSSPLPKEYIQSKIKSWQLVTQQVVMEQLGLIDAVEPTQEEKKALFSGKKDKEIAEALVHA